MSQCPTCEGSGTIDREVPHMETEVWHEAVSCPTCSGRGWVLDPEALEAACEGVIRSSVGNRLSDDQAHKVAEAVVVAYLEKTQ